MVKQSIDYPWSRYRATVGYYEAGEWLDVDWTLSQFGRQKKRAIEKYSEFVEEGIYNDPPLNDLQGQLALGSDKFVTKVLAKLPKESQKDLSEIPKKQRRKIYALSTYFRNKDRSAAIYDAYYSGGYSQREIGDYWGHHYSTVSRWLKRYEEHRKT